MKKLLLAILAVAALSVTSLAQHPLVTDLNYGSGNVVKEWSGTGAPADSCPTSLASYVQSDAPLGQNIWKCVAGHMKQQGGSSTGATLPSSGIVFATSTTASRAATYSDIVLLFGSGSCSGYVKSDGTCGTPSGGGTNPGATSGFYRWNGTTWILAVAGADYYAPDTVNNAQLVFQSGSGGDTTCTTVASAMVLCYKAANGRILASINQGAWYPIPVSTSGSAGSLVKYDTNGIDLVTGPATVLWFCQPGYGDGKNVIAAGPYPETACKNKTGKTITISFIGLTTDAGTSTMTVTNGSGTALLTGAVTGTTSEAAGTQSGTVTLAPNDVLKFTFTPDGTTTKQMLADVVGSYPI